MKYRIDWSQEARARLLVLGDFIATRSPAAAARVVRRLLDRTRLLESQPEIGRVFPDAPSPDLRLMVFGNYKVVYLVIRSEGRVFVLTVQHGKELPVTLEEILAGLGPD